MKEILLVLFLMTTIICDTLVSNRKNPTEKNRKKRNILNKVFFEGDVILNHENANSSDVKNAYLANPSRLWTGGVVFYLIDKNSILDKQVHENIYQAIKDISGCSCLVFKEFDANNATGDYIKFRMHGDSKNSGDSCWSYLGRVGGGQVINIPFPCTTIEIIKHEIFHATGALHEHNRPDRDKFVKILYDNIKPGMARNFAKRKWEYLDELNGVESFGTPYDAQSILHYPANAHGINGNITIQPLHKLNTTIGSTGDMTITDIIELNLVYGCDIASDLLVEYIHQTVARGSLSQGVKAAIETQAEINVNNTEKIMINFNNTKEIKRKMEENAKNDEAFKNSATFTISNIVQNNEVLEEKISQLEEKIASLENSNKWEKNVLKEKSVNCEFGPWGEFESCTATCGGGFMTRWRNISTQAQFNGQECQGRRNETWICNTEDCPSPVDCSWTLWEDVGECSTNICGSVGTIQTTRKEAQQAKHGGKQCHGGNTATRNCIQQCEVAMIVGGASAPKKVELWGPDKKCNYELPDTTLNRGQPTTNYFDGKVLTCGGDGGAHGNNCYYMDFSIKTWKFHSSLRKKRYYHSSVSMGNVLYLIGSIDGGSYQTAEYLEAGSTTWKDGPALHNVYFGSCTVKISQSAFVVIGGQNSRRKVRQYNVTSQSWSYLPDLLSDRVLFGCVMVDVRAPGREPVSGILVAGGRSPTQQTAEFMNMETMKWQKTTNLFNNHEDGIMADLGGRYFIFGGQNTKKVEEFDPWNLGWKTGTGYQDLKHLRNEYSGITTVSCGQF